MAELFAQVLAGTVQRIDDRDSLPGGVRLPDGRTMTGFDAQPPSVLRVLGWLPYSEERPQYDPARFTLSQMPRFDIRADRVVGVFELVPLPPTFTVDRATIPADGATAAVFTYRDERSDAPARVTFVANGVETAVALDDGLARLEVTSTTAGDRVDVSLVGGAPVTALHVFVD